MEPVSHSPPKATRREWIGLAVIALPCLLYSMDLTVLNLAAPSLSADLKPTASQLLWIVDIYGFLIAGSLITMGTLGDRIGRRRLLLFGAAAFGVASVLAAFSRSAETLIVTRALLGIAGATLAPSTLSLIRNMFLDPAERTFAIGVWSMSFSAGAAMGPMLGGILLQYFWWGSVFLIGVPVMALLLTIGPTLLPEYRDPNAGKLDIASAALSLVSVLAVIYGLKQIAEHGIGWPATVAIIGGVAFGFIFVRRQRTLTDPMIDLRLFRAPSFSLPLAAYTFSVFVTFGIFFYIAQYLQLVAGLTPLRAGFCTVPSSLGFVASSIIAPILVRHIRPAYVMAGGAALAAIGLGLLTQIDAFGIPGLIVGSVIFAFGITPMITLSVDLIVGTASAERAGAASAISETGAELGGALGIAILGSIGTAVYLGTMTRALPGGISPELAFTASATLGGAVNAATQLPDPLAAELLTVARAAFTRSFELAMEISVILVLVLAVTVTTRLRRIGANRVPSSHSTEG